MSKFDWRMEMVIDEFDKDFLKISEERSTELNFCCYDCADTGFKVGKEFERNRILNFLQDNKITLSGFDNHNQLIEKLFGNQNE